MVMVTGLMVILDTMYSYVFKASEPRSKIQKILQVSERHYDYVFLGSSRTENHIDCEIITKITGRSCINFGISGGTIGDMLVLMKLMEVNKVTYDKVFLQVDYNYNHKGLSANFKARLMPFVNEPLVRKELDIVGMGNAQKIVPFYRFMKNDKVIGFREFVTSVLNKKPRTDLNVGFAPKEGIGNIAATSFPKVIRESNTEIEVLKDFVQANKKELFFFTAPYCSEVNGRERAMKQIKKRLPELWDYSNLYDDTYEYFYNCGHLNIHGAQDFSRIIANRELLKTN